MTWREWYDGLTAQGSGLTGHPAPGTPVDDLED